tara:strand:+ start:1629 stop:2126 length:498 start_codon:yes stop_codon:yes gene_type:complete
MKIERDKSISNLMDREADYIGRELASDDLKTKGFSIVNLISVLYDSPVPEFFVCAMTYAAKHKVDLLIHEGLQKEGTFTIPKDKMDPKELMLIEKCSSDEFVILMTKCVLCMVDESTFFGDRPIEYIEETQWLSQAIWMAMDYCSYNEIDLQGKVEKIINTYASY